MGERGSCPESAKEGHDLSICPLSVRPGCSTQAYISPQALKGSRAQGRRGWDILIGLTVLPTPALLAECFVSQRMIRLITSRQGSSSSKMYRVLYSTVLFFDTAL